MLAVVHILSVPILTLNETKTKASIRYAKAMKPNNTNQPPQSATGNGSSFDMVRHGTADTQSVDTLQPFETSLSSQAAVNQGNALDTASLPDSDNDMPTPPKQHMPRNRMLGLGLLAFGIMAAILLGIRIDIYVPRPRCRRISALQGKPS